MLSRKSNFNLLFIFAVSLSASTFAGPPPEVAVKETHGGAGDSLSMAAVKSDFLKMLPDLRKQIGAWASASPLAAHVSLSKLDALILGININQVAINPTNDLIYIPGDPEPKDFRNYAPILKVDIQAQRWWIGKKKPNQLHSTVFHELLNLIGLELDDYIYSKDFRVFLENSNPDPIAKNEPKTASQTLDQVIDDPHYLFGMHDGRVILHITGRPETNTQTFVDLIEQKTPVGDCAIVTIENDVNLDQLIGASYSSIDSTYRIDSSPDGRIGHMSADAHFEKVGRAPGPQTLNIHCETAPGGQDTSRFIAMLESTEVAAALGDRVYFEILQSSNR